ncbi:MAG TPA: hypothetical protein GX708_18720 [Gallicola sp.]|nr:hypothetical protein [Gallicola sp.]
MRNKKILVLLVCLTLIFSVGCGTSANTNTNSEPDAREKEVVKLVADLKYNEARDKTKDLYKGREQNKMLKWIDEMEELGKKIEMHEKNISQTLKEIEAFYPSSKLEIQPEHRYKSKDGYGYVVGKVKNVSDASITYFEVVVDLLDDKGNILHSEYTNDGLELKPNAMREFEIMFKDSDEYEKYRLSIGKVK